MTCIRCGMIVLYRRRDLLCDECRREPGPAAPQVQVRPPRVLRRDDGPVLTDQASTALLEEVFGPGGARGA